MEDEMVDFITLGVLSLFGYRPILAPQNAYAVAFSLDRRDPAYTVAFSAI
jgi:hypothetical protein